MTDVLWYLHDHGFGHVRRFERIVSHMQASVVTMGSLEAPNGGHRHAKLVRDDDGSRSDVTANGRLHFAPLQGDGLRRRHAQMAMIVEDVLPSLAVVDVSVEVGVFLRLMGVPVVTVRQPGIRSDHAHSLLYDVAEEILAPWPEEWELAEAPPPTTYLGLPAPPVPPFLTRDWSATIVVGGGKSPITRYLVEAIADAAPGMAFRVAGMSGAGRGNVEYLGHVPDVIELIAGSAVAIGGAGLNTVAEVAATGTPFVCIPGERPFGEQLFTARALARSGAAVVVESPDICDDWDSIIGRALDLDPGAMRRFVDPDGWRKAAAIVDRSVVSVAPAKVGL